MATEAVCKDKRKTVGEIGWEAEKKVDSEKRKSKKCMGLIKLDFEKKRMLK